MIVSLFVNFEIVYDIVNAAHRFHAQQNITHFVRQDWTIESDVAVLCSHFDRRGMRNYSAKSRAHAIHQNGSVRLLTSRVVTSIQSPVFLSAKFHLSPNSARLRFPLSGSNRYIRPVPMPSP